MIDYHKENGVKVEKEIYIKKSLLDYALKIENCSTKKDLELKLKKSNIYPKDVKFIILED